MSLPNLTKELIYTYENGVATLALNRPEKLNACTTSMYDGIARVAEEVRDNDEIKVLIITGVGKGFCSGSDAEERLAARKKVQSRSRKELIHPLGYSAIPLYTLSKPTIAAINGICVGSGLSIALLCDIRIASDRARFGALWIKRGLIPDLGATYLLPQTVGLDRALELAITGDLVDAHRAEEMGLVTRVVPHDVLMGATNELARKIASGPSVAVELTKRGMYRGLTSDYASQLDFETYAQNMCFQTEDFKESIVAFREKRKPRFQGK